MWGYEDLGFRVEALNCVKCAATPFSYSSMLAVELRLSLHGTMLQLRSQA